MRYYIMFGITLLLCLVILFYTPYLGIYKNNVSIKFDLQEEGYTWKYNIEGNSLKFDKEENNMYTFKTNGVGTTKITFTHSNNDDTKYEVYYKFYVIAGHIFWKESIGSGFVDYPNPF